MGQLCDEVSERYDAVCAQNGWQLKLEIRRTKSCLVCADPNMMQRALHNLLGNAMHHIGGDGIFVLRALQGAPRAVRVEIEDHGPGICAEDLPHIFDRYYRSRSDAGKQGTGLGLSITKAIFQQHGFRFGVHSTVGKGTVFWFIMTDTRRCSCTTKLPTFCLFLPKSYFSLLMFFSSTPIIESDSIYCIM
ncbi:MAG: sensor histidine kinase [Faecalibacterium prausnitzii]